MPLLTSSLLTSLFTSPELAPPRRAAPRRRDSTARGCGRGEEETSGSRGERQTAVMWKRKRSRPPRTSREGERAPWEDDGALWPVEQYRVPLKVVLLGAPAVGKTRLLERFAFGSNEGSARAADFVAAPFNDAVDALADERPYVATREADFTVRSLELPREAVMSYDSQDAFCLHGSDAGDDAGVAGANAGACSGCGDGGGGEGEGESRARDGSLLLRSASEWVAAHRRHHGDGADCHASGNDGGDGASSQLTASTSFSALTGVGMGDDRACRVTAVMQVYDTAGGGDEAASGAARARDAAVAAARPYAHFSTAVCLVYDLTRRSTFDAACSTWHALFARNMLESVPSPSSLSSSPPALSSPELVGVMIANKADELRELHQVRREEAEAWCARHGYVFFEASAKSGHGVFEAMEELARIALRRKRLLIERNISATAAGTNEAAARVAVEAGEEDAAAKTMARASMPTAAPRFIRVLGVDVQSHLLARLCL